MINSLVGTLLAIAVTLGYVQADPEFEVSSYVQEVQGKPIHSVLWIAIRNKSPQALIVCRMATAVSFIPIDRSKPAVGDGKLDPGCGTEGFDPWWVLMPGERRFESHKLSQRPELDVELYVSVNLLVKTEPDAESKRVHVESEGTTVRKALEAWRSLWLGARKAAAHLV